MRTDSSDKCHVRISAGPRDCMDYCRASRELAPTGRQNDLRPWHCQGRAVPRPQGSSRTGCSGAALWRFVRLPPPSFCHPCTPGPRSVGRSGDASQPAARPRRRRQRCRHFPHSHRRDNGRRRAATSTLVKPRSVPDVGRPRKTHLPTNTVLGSRMMRRLAPGKPIPHRGARGEP